MLTERPSFGDLLQEYRVLHKLLSGHNKVVIDNFMPRMERLEENLRRLTRDTNERITRLEAAVQDLIVEHYSSSRKP